VRIDVPEGEHPTLWATRKLGSPRLIAARDDLFDAVYFPNSPLTPRERELIRMRFVYEASCNLCGETRAARDMPGFADEEIPEDLYEHILEYRTYPAFTERERLLLQFSERYWSDYRELCFDDEFWATFSANFSDVELADLCLLVGHWDSSTKMFHLLLGFDDACAVPRRDGEKLLERAPRPPLAR
jgi:alkylhydroperoxidase family enzyme